MKKSRHIVAAFILLLQFGSVFSQFSITASITDSVSGNPVSDARGELIGSGKVKHSSSGGLLFFEELGAGNFILRVSADQFFTKEISISLIDKSLNIELALQPFESSTDTIDVRAKFFKRDETVSTSYTNTFNEEIRKTPGSGEDVVRYFMSSPGVSVGWDLYNTIIARGGSPVENLTVLDGLEIQNPNHYGTPGSSGGVLSFINLKLVKDVDFYTGGFPPKYGGRISSVMDIKFKEGDHKRQWRAAYISMTGVGAFLEGPINSRSSFMVSARRSYFELVKEQLEVPLLPEYWDFNAKLNYNISGSDKIIYTGVFAIDNAYPYEKQRDFWGDTANIKFLASGITYEKTGKNFLSKSIFGYNWNNYRVKYDNYMIDIDDNELYLKEEADIRVRKNVNLNLFAVGKYIFSNYYVNRNGIFNSSNYFTLPLLYDSLINTYKIAFGFNLTGNAIDNRLVLNFGLRFDKFGYIDELFTLSPRLGLTYKLNNNLFLNGSYGIYYQQPELLWVASNEKNRNLKSIRADTYVLGIEQFFSNDIRLCVEGYLKQYMHYPVSEQDPNFIFINSGVDFYPNFLDEASSRGKGYFGGVDITFQKKNPGYGLFWTMVYSYSKSEFLALSGDIQPAMFDYHHQLTAIGGIKLESDFSFSVRFKYAGRRPYTPFNTELSIELGRGVYDMSQYNKGRLPEYVRFDFRVDKQFFIRNTSLLLYFEVENLFNRENVFNYYWSWQDNAQKANIHWSILPIGGISWEF